MGLFTHVYFEIFTRNLFADNLVQTVTSGSDEAFFSEPSKVNVEIGLTNADELMSDLSALSDAAADDGENPIRRGESSTGPVQERLSRSVLSSAR
jgi:hypothetical protein